MFDSVREELQTKITSGRLTSRPVPSAETNAAPAVAVQTRPASFTPPTPASAVAVPRPAVSSMQSAAVAVAVAPAREREKPVQTADLSSPKTSPTLVGFQSNNPTLPDWRIKLQNAVQQRKGIAANAPDPVVNGTIMPASAAETVKPTVVQRAPAAVAPVSKISDPRVANAMRRIDESRSTFLEPPPKPVVKATPVPAKSYKFDVVQNSTATAPVVNRFKTPPPALQVVAAPPPVKRDTNKLPPISMRSMPAAEPAIEVRESADVSIHETSPTEFAAVNRIRIKAEVEDFEPNTAVQAEAEEIDDLALFSTRFGAGFFDLLITSFASMLILSPIALSRDGWFSLAGVLAFVGVTSIVTFFYMTICLGFYGKTMGMRLFSLELVDAVENEYPTLHQAAVSSSVFLLSLIFGGAGFITMLFNEEKRAAHDLLSGTILVREF